MLGGNGKELMSLVLLSEKANIKRPNNLPHVT